MAQSEVARQLAAEVRARLDEMLGPGWTGSSRPLLVAPQPASGRSGRAGAPTEAVAAAPRGRAPGPVSAGSADTPVGAGPARPRTSRGSRRAPGRACSTGCCVPRSSSCSSPSLSARSSIFISLRLGVRPELRPDAVGGVDVEAVQGEAAGRAGGVHRQVEEGRHQVVAGDEQIPVRRHGLVKRDGAGIVCPGAQFGRRGVDRVGEPGEPRSLQTHRGAFRSWSPGDPVLPADTPGCWGETVA